MLLGTLRRRIVNRGAASGNIPESSRSSIDIVKWIIPSVSVFAALTGFVAESAHQGLLGVDRGDLGATAYIWSAGQFISSVIRAVSSAVFLPRFFSVDSTVELWLWAATAAIGLALYCIQRFTKGKLRSSLHRRIIFTSLLAMIVIWRLLIIEVPLARVEKLLVGGTDVIEESVRYDGFTTAEQAIQRRSVAFYSLLLCERQHGAKVHALRQTCQEDREYSTDSMRLMLVAIGISITMLGIIVLLWSEVSIATATVLLAPVAIYCCLAPAFVYGKLVKQPSFESALIQVKTGLQQMPAQTAFQGRPAVENNSGGQLFTAIILGHDDKMVSLYVSQIKTCGDSPPTYEWVPWQIPLSEVVAMREIQSLDVISERLKQVSCPDSPPPP